MNKILQSIQPVIKDSKYVKINLENLNRVCESYNPLDIDFWLDQSPGNYGQLDDQKKLNFIFIVGSVNFCYWGDPKWTVEYKGNQYDGAYGMVSSLFKAIENNIPLLDAKYLSAITEKDLSEIFKGNVEIPLFKERLNILQENGKILDEKYNGQFGNVIEKSGFDTLQLLDLITSDFPTFNDFAFYNEHKVLFHKRAQLTISDVYRSFKGKGFGDLKNINELTAFADYKVPQSLRKIGVLEYSPELASKVDNKIQIPLGSEQEIEIRANMIWAVELMKRELKKRSEIDAANVDSYLWLMGQKKSPDDKPYHLTKTIFY